MTARIADNSRPIILGLLACAMGLALAMLPLPAAGGILVGSTALVLTLIHPIVGVGLAVLAVPIQELVVLPGGVSFVQAALLLVLGCWSLWLLAHHERRLLLGLILPGLLLLLWALVLSVHTTAYSQSEGIKETIRWASVALVYLVTYNALRAHQSPHWYLPFVVVCVMLAPASSGAVGLYQSLTSAGPAGFVIEDAFLRAYGTIGQPNSFAGYLNMAWGLAVAVTAGAGWRVWQVCRGRVLPPHNTPTHYRHDGSRTAAVLFIVGGISSLITLGGLYASLSRGGWLGAVAGGGSMLLALFVMQSNTRRRMIGRWIAAAAMGALLLVVLGNAGVLPGAVQERFTSIFNNLRLFDVRNVETTPDNFAVVERMAHLQAAWDMYRTNPVSGVGVGSFSLAYEGDGTIAQPYAFHPWYTSRGHAHNYYLHIAAEAGTIGLTAYLILTTLVLYTAYQATQHARGWLWQTVTIGGCGIIGAVMVHNVFENLHVLNFGVQLGAVWGLLAAAGAGADTHAG